MGATDESTRQLGPIAAVKEMRDRFVYMTAEAEAKKNKDACDAVIVEIKKKYQKVKAHVLKNFRGALGELDFP